MILLILSVALKVTAHVTHIGLLARHGLENSYSFVHLNIASHVFIYYSNIIIGGTPEGEASQDSVGLGKLGGPGEKNRKLQKK